MSSDQTDEIENEVFISDIEWDEEACESTNSGEESEDENFKSYTFIHDDRELPEEERCNDILFPRIERMRQNATKVEKVTRKVKKVPLESDSEEEEESYSTDDCGWSSSEEGVEYRRVKGQPRFIRLIPSWKGADAIWKLRNLEDDNCVQTLAVAGGTCTIKSCAQGSCPREGQSKFSYPGPFLQCITNHFTTSCYGIDDEVDEVDQLQEIVNGPLKKERKLPAPHVTPYRPCTVCRFWKFQHYAEPEVYYDEYLHKITYLGHRSARMKQSKKFSKKKSGYSSDTEGPTIEMLLKDKNSIFSYWARLSQASVPVQTPASSKKVEKEVKEKVTEKVKDKVIEKAAEKVKDKVIEKAVEKVKDKRESISLPRLVELAPPVPLPPPLPRVQNKSCGPPRQRGPLPWNIKQKSQNEKLVLPPVKPMYESVGSRYMPPPPDLEKKLKHPDVLWSTLPLRLQKKKKRKPVTPRPAFGSSGLRRPVKKFKKPVTLSASSSLERSFKNSAAAVPSLEDRVTTPAQMARDTSLERTLVLPKIMSRIPEPTTQPTAQPTAQPQRVHPGVTPHVTENYLPNQRMYYTFSSKPRPLGEELFPLRSRSPIDWKPSDNSKEFIVAPTSKKLDMSSSKKKSKKMVSNVEK